MTPSNDFLRVLGLAGDADLAAIRRAYAGKLKRIDQEADPAGFQELREAYEAASAWAKAGTGPAAARPPATIPHVSMPAAPVNAAPGVRTSESVQAPSDAELADSVFDAMGSAFQSVLDEGGRWDAGDWLMELSDRLGDERLVSLGARIHFEGRLVERLARGWHPGHESLFAAACDLFEWETDRGRLGRFGQAGAMLAQAADEWAGFRSQDAGTRIVQEGVAARMRQASAPTRSELLHSIMEIQAMAERYPALVHVTIGTDNLSRWHAAYWSPAADGGAGRPGSGKRDTALLLKIALPAALGVWMLVKAARHLG